MAEKMDALRNPCPEAIDGKAVTLFADYKKQEILDKTTGGVSSTNLPASNVLSFTLDNGDVIVVRPSGTEPKIKYYFLLRGENKAEADAKLESYKKSLGV
jgi:phosphoglucomutase